MEDKIKYIVTETTLLHNKVAEAYEALADGEIKEGIKLLDEIADKTRDMKKDLLTKEV
jgi:hypothetical protein